MPELIQAQFGNSVKTCTVTGSGTCRNCGSLVTWVKTPKGKTSPVDPHPSEDGVYVAHFAQCNPSAKQPAAGQQASRPNNFRDSSDAPAQPGTALAAPGTVPESGSFWLALTINTLTLLVEQLRQVQRGGR